METNTLGHLIEIESKAAALLMDAQTEADRRTAQARAQADADYKTQYEKLVSEFETDAQERMQTLKNQYTAAFDSFKSELDGCHRDTAAFDALLEKLFFGN